MIWVRRRAAAASAAAMRAWLADPSLGGERSLAHVKLARPRRGVWLAQWSRLPGLMHDLGSCSWSHALLPGWQYTLAEMRTEMIDDLEHFAVTGERPKSATR